MSVRRYWKTGERSGGAEKGLTIFVEDEQAAYGAFRIRLPCVANSGSNGAASFETPARQRLEQHSIERPRTEDSSLAQADLYVKI